MLKTLAIVIGIVVAVLLVTAGVGYYLITRPSEVEQQAASMDISDETSQRAEDKINAFTEQLSTVPAGETVQLTLTDDEVTSSLLKELESNDMELPLDLQNPRILFVEDKILFSGDVAVSGFETNVAIEARAETQDSQLKLTIDEIDLGKLPLPEAVIDQLMGNFSEGEEILIDLNELDIPLDLQNIIIENGQIVIAGSAQ